MDLPRTLISPAGVDMRPWRPTLSEVVVRLLLLLVAWVTLVAQPAGPRAPGLDDQVAAVMEVDDGGSVLELPDGALGAASPLRVPCVALVPAPLHGTERDHVSPATTRVFRPPRRSFG